MSSKLLQPWNPAFQPEWAFEDIRITFFKCVRWQVEETFDPINCPYHYFCDSTYPGNYPPYVDVIVFLFATASYLATLVIMVMDISRRGEAHFSRYRRFLLPSGPISLPIILLTLTKGYRINSIFPLSCIGPAILQLLYVSSLAFDIGVDKDVRYALYEASTISGILHGSLHLDSIILPYYTGFDALVSSTFSGECQSCVCRREVLLVGGKLVTYRGWSVTTFLVVGALCLRIIRRMSGQNSSTIMAIKSLLESLGWISITLDCIYLTRKAPPEQPMMRITAFGSILALVCLHLTKKLSSHTTRYLQNYMNRIPMRSRKG
ncbi:hypothetical protein P3X46_003389 [Hevea brasiliensis]|uniref:Uncharacterized protein n=1 Tax=Hevea brasiliensis TaxID=3981 RepID=A0ABQ9N633_HEVBR|nr:uncharacterized protein LOC110661685 [Hevea brasiliensis]KAJ9187984.1 hypothetical protein P3X46_003389 [Hevea brasiliensis]